MSLTTRVTTENCNGKECYKLELSKMVIDNKNEGKKSIDKYKRTEYIDKNIGLVVRYIDTENINLIPVNKEEPLGHVTDYKYEFGNVKDEEFIEPDKSEYTIINE